jgi:hypothetical protein
MSDSLPDPQADVEHLLVQTLEEEERRLAELEERVSRLQSSPQPRGEISEEQLPPDPSVTQEDLNEARNLLAQSGEHLRQLQGRLNELEGVPHAIVDDAQEPSADEDGTDRFQLVLGPGAGASVEPVPKRDALDLGDVDSFLPQESLPSAADLETPTTRAGWGASQQSAASAPAANPSGPQTAPPVTSKGWGESTPLPRPQQAGVPRPTGGFRNAEIMPDPNDLATPTTAGGWGGDPDASDVFRAEVFVTRPEPAPDSPTARHDAPPIDPNDPAFETSDHLAIQVPVGEPTGAPEPASQPTIEPPEIAPQVVLPPPAEAIQGPHPGTPGYLVSAGPAAVAGQIAAAAHADRFDLGNKFGGGREPSLRELWQNQERILRRLEALSAQVGDMAQAQLNEVDTLRARAERAERICTQALSQAQTRATRWEAAVSGLASRSEVAASAPAADPLPGATQQLVRLLRDAINATPEPEPEPPKPDRFEVLRERLLAMGNEHQTLVSRHANLLEDLLGLLDPAEEE